VRCTIAEAIARDEGASPATGGGDSERLVGTLVHRLVHRLGVGADSAIARAAVARLLRPEEQTECGFGLDPDATLVAAVAAYEALSRNEAVTRLYSSGEALHELPFTMQRDGTWLRGTIDCLVRNGSGLITVLEFKTGRPRPEHQRQVELYRCAVEQMFPGHHVEARLVYATSVSLPAAHSNSFELSLPPEGG
jgi:ATP-dependent exoDNAse (exonuclease V) beta subunit